MCGIAGYVGPRPTAPVLLESLKRLEYRGYDSCGVAIFSDLNVKVTRSQGRVMELLEKVSPSISGGYMGMAHTRWATHGVPSERNAHPLTSCQGDIAAVHNGIIENASLLREDLIRQGHRFTSDTDSEVIPHLLEAELAEGRTLDVAMLRLRERLRGSFAIIAARKGERTLYAMRRGSPLVVGIGDGEYFPASDIPSFLQYTRRVLYLHEDDCVAITPSGVQMIRQDLSGAIRWEPPPVPSVIDFDPESLSKGEFDHFMIKEIMEQAGILERIIYRQPEVLAPAVEKLSRARHIYLVGAGTSYHAGLYGEYLLAQLARRRSTLTIASEFETVAPLITEEDTVVALSQSGETADTLLAAQLAKERGAQLVGLVNVEASSLARLADLCVPLRSGLELAVASTKTYTAQLALLYQIVARMAGQQESSCSELWRARDGLYHLTSEAARDHCRSVGRVFAEARDVFLVGRGIHRVTALEAALKLKEVARLRAEAFPGGEMKHGPLALVQDGTPVIIFYGEGDAVAAEASASELASRGAQIYSVGPQPLRVSTDHIRVVDTGYSNPITQMVPMQILAYETARLKNLDPDHPRNLAKAVTVT